MSTRRYAVLDENGVKLNCILVDDPYPAEYWPGYGRYIVCEHNEPNPTPPVNPEILERMQQSLDPNIRALGRRVVPKRFTWLPVRPQGRFEIGDTMNITTGAITPKPVPPPEPDPVP